MAFLLASGAGCGGKSSSAAPGPGGSSGGAGGDTSGRFGAPELTFTLPGPGADGGFAADVQVAYPQVDWAHLDRLYIPAGTYRYLSLLDLPVRSADRPLVITNTGGQVKVGGRGSNVAIFLGGGANWIFTSRYDAVSKTGDPGFPGHAGGNYAHSQGTYGIVVEDAYSASGDMGLLVGGRATDFELEFVEIGTTEFAGLVIKTDDDGTATMRNVKIHDMYVHDTGGEGIYLGSTQTQPQHSFEDLDLHDNRFLRTGSAAIQVTNLGGGCRIHHNVSGPAGMRWRERDWEVGAQDQGAQVAPRYGSISYDHNLFIGGNHSFMAIFATDVAGDVHGAGDTLTVSDNLFQNTLQDGILLSRQNAMSYRFERNVFRGLRAEVYPEVFGYEPTTVVFTIYPTDSTVALQDNRWEGSRALAYHAGVSGFSSGGDTSEPTIAPPEFRDFMGLAPDANYSRVEWWTDRIWHRADQPAVTYQPGDVVSFEGSLYQATATNSQLQPDQHPEAWAALPSPADDVRLTSTSPYQGLGLQ